MNLKTFDNLYDVKVDKILISYNLKKIYINI
jgi:hypothetical protein